MTIAFLGMGLMGSAMARNLLKAGHAVRVWNRSPAAAEALVVDGAVFAASAAEAVQGCAIVFSMLADDVATHGVFLEQNLLAQMAPGTVHANCATISIPLAQELAAAHAKAGITYLATPVMGNSLAAAAAKLNILTAGDAEAIKQLEPLFLTMGQAVWPQGDQPHLANAVKIGTNFLLGAAIEGMSEAVALTQAHGVDPEQFIDFITSTVFGAPVYKLYGEKIAKQQYEPAAFRLALGAKDMKLACDSAAERGLKLPLGELVAERIGEAVALGNGEKDLAALALAPLKLV